MSKDQVWKITFCFHTSRPEKFFADYSRLENDQTFFHTFPYSVGTLLNRTLHFACLGHSTGLRTTKARRTAVQTPV